MKLKGVFITVLLVVFSLVAFVPLPAHAQIPTAWASTTAIVAGGNPSFSFGSIVAYNGYVYAVSKSANGGTYYAQLMASGAVGTWTYSRPVPFDDNFYPCWQDSGYIYCIGVGDEIYSAPLSSSGIGSWTLQASTFPITPDAYGERCVDATGYVYCIGGKDISSTIYSTVSTAWVNSGTVGSWSSSSYPIPIENAGCAIVGNTIYCEGGATTGPTDTAEVYYAPITSPGNLGAGWTAGTNFPYDSYLNSYCVAYKGEAVCGFISSTTMYSYSGGSSGTWTADGAASGYTQICATSCESIYAPQFCATDGTNYITCAQWNNGANANDFVYAYSISTQTVQGPTVVVACSYTSFECWWYPFFFFCMMIAAYGTLASIGRPDSKALTYLILCTLSSASFIGEMMGLYNIVVPLIVSIAAVVYAVRR